MPRARCEYTAFNVVSFEVFCSTMAGALKRRIVAAFTLCSLTVAKWPNMRPPKPRGIVLFFLDDHGYGDWNVTETPHLNSLAAGGLTLTDFHAAFSVCTPSRAGLMTGRLAPRTGVGKNFGEASIHGLALSEVILPQVLGTVNFKSHMIGKWHLGHADPHQPTSRGFSSFFGLPYSGDMGCIDATPQGCAPDWDRSTGQPACPALCGETRMTAVPLYDSSSRNCSGKASCNDDIVEQPFDPLSLSKRYAERAETIIRKHATSV